MNLDENTDSEGSDSTRFGGTDPTSTTIGLRCRHMENVNTNNNQSMVGVMRGKPAWTGKYEGNVGI